MNADEKGETDLSLEELSGRTGFLKKSKQSSSEVSLLVGDLEGFRRLARIRRFDEHTGACIQTITQLAGESGFLPESEATHPEVNPVGRETPVSGTQRDCIRHF